MDIDFYYVQDEYVAYLKEAEKFARGFTCVPNTQYRSRNKFLFGACFQHDGINYFVPVSHQIKHGDNNIIMKTKPKKGKS
ncbi:type III toxin-antitoxin system ToxN/AbiQ family toxin, partial [bacterium]|nr:type III toxin-antitoxin system ToxN/AbiQ family toxin [bacterium]